MLFSVYGPVEGAPPLDVSIQVTQTNTILYMDTSLESYVEKDSIKLFSFKNNSPNQSLLFYTSTKVPDCFTVTAYSHDQNN